jgi:membrane protein
MERAAEVPNVPLEQDPPKNARDPHVIVNPSNVRERAIWEYVSLRPIRSLWDMKGVSPLVVIKRTWASTWRDDLFGWAAELGYWFLFALFPTLVSASSIIGIALRHVNYGKLLHYLGMVLPPAASSMVLTNFTQLTHASNGKKLGFGLLAGIWAASSGFSAIQDAMNVVYRVKETRPYWKVKGISIIITPLLCLMVSAVFASLLLGDFLGLLASHHVFQIAARATVVAIRVAGWAVAWFLLMLMFAVIYYYSPNVKKRQFRMLTPGAALGTIGWLLASFGLRVYLHFFNTYTATYGSLGVVIILLTWFYITGLMLLFGGEFNSEIEAAAAEKLLTEKGKIPDAAPAEVEAA